MTGMVPGLHPNTRPQREGESGKWAIASRNAFETRDAPPRWVALGLAGTIIMLLLSVAATIWFVNANKPRTALLAGTAKARFNTAGPPLESTPRADLEALKRAHPAPEGPVLDAAMDAVVRQGWGDATPAPSRGEIALERAGAAQ